MENKDAKQSWWRPAIEIGGLVSSWIIAPIILALIIGKWLDTYFDTTPIIFLSLAGFAFLISLFGVARSITKYIRQIENISKKDVDTNQPK